jgi:Zn finger protein HypA/HybF involved in hydrogenase expression
MTDKQTKEKYNCFIQALKDGRLQEIIDTIYSEEFNDSFPTILNITEKEFFTNITQKAAYVLGEEYSNQCLSSSIVKELTSKTEDRIRDTIYKPTLSALEEAMSKYSKENIYTKNFIKHCANSECYALHTCKRKLTQLKVLDKVVFYCAECKATYQSDLLHLYCTYCNVSYYSNIADEFELKPATWVNYHCGALVNEKMRCVKCNSTFYLDAKRNTLFCCRCNFEVDPLKIFWKCIICNEEFKNLAKYYNANEFKMLKNAIKNAIMERVKARPTKVPCCPIDRIEDFIFIHKKECDGFLYKTVFNNKTLVVCEKCKTMNYFDKFIWTCPRCGKRFRMKSGSDGQDRTPSKDRLPYYKGNNESEDKPLKPVRLQSGNVIRIVAGDNQTPNKLVNEKVIRIPLSSRGSDAKPHERNNCLRVEDKSPPQVRRIIYKSEEKYGQIIQRAIMPNIAKIHINDKQGENNNVRKSLNFSDDESANKKGFKKDSKDSKSTNESDMSEDNTALHNFNKNDYKEVSKIGQGSFGVIYSVIDKNEKTFAMKKIIAHGGKELQEFTKEYELVHSCQHKNIVKLLGVCTTKLDNTTHALYILMEQALTDWEKEILKRGHTKAFYKEEELMGILKLLASTLAFLQRRKISHRDIKPQNILIYPGDEFKLADFGEAKRLTNEFNTLRGTEIYMSPILFYGLRNKSSDVIHNTYKSDVFSLGLCILYAATLNIRCLVDIRELTNMKVLINVINKHLRDRYSSKFHSILRKMLELEERLRVDFIELEKELNEMLN